MNWIAGISSIQPRRPIRWRKRWHTALSPNGRILALDPVTHNKLEEELKTKLPAGSSDKGDWLSLSHVRELRRVASDNGAVDLRDLVEPAHQLRTRNA